MGIQLACKPGACW